MDCRSPTLVLREAFANDLKMLNEMMMVGNDRDARVLARRLAPRVYLVVAGHRASELYDKLKVIAGCGTFAARSTTLPARKGSACSDPADGRQRVREIHG